MLVSSSTVKGDKPWNANSGFGCITWLGSATSSRGGVTNGFFDYEIVAVYFWAVLHDRGVSWACEPINWSPDLRPWRIPSQSTMSRRMRSAEVQRLMGVMEQRLRQQCGAPGWVNVVDGKPLVVGSHSKDPDARWGRAGRSYAKGYRLHAVYGSAPLPRQWEITAMNVSEPEVAARLIPALNGGGYLLGDKIHDSNPLHEVALATGYQLVAPRKRPGTGLGHRPHAPGRLRSMALLTKDFGKALYRCRMDIERQFGWLTNHAAGLSPLPSWVRRLSRVQTWVHAKLIIHIIYAYCYHPPPLLADA